MVTVYVRAFVRGGWTRVGIMLALCGCGGEVGHEDDVGTSGDGDGTETGEDTQPVCGQGRRPADAPDDEPVAISLIDQEQWQQIGAVEDPFSDHRPDDIDCGPAGWELEFDGFEVDTIDCNYMAAAQPSAVELCAGDTVRLDFQHFDLLAPELAQAHAAVMVGGQALLDYQVEIGPEDIVPARKWDESILVEDDAPTGTFVHLHVHNHGFNTYKLLAVELILPPSG